MSHLKELTRDEFQLMSDIALKISPRMIWKENGLEVSPGWVYAELWNFHSRFELDLKHFRYAHIQDQLNAINEIRAANRGHAYYLSSTLLKYKTTNRRTS